MLTETLFQDTRHPCTLQQTTRQHRRPRHRPKSRTRHRRLPTTSLVRTVPQHGTTRPTTALPSLIEINNRDAEPRGCPQAASARCPSRTGTRRSRHRRLPRQRQAERPAGKVATQADEASSNGCSTRSARTRNPPDYWFESTSVDLTEMFAIAHAVSRRQSTRSTCNFTLNRPSSTARCARAPYRSAHGPTGKARPAIRGRVLVALDSPAALRGGRAASRSPCT